MLLMSLMLLSSPVIRENRRRAERMQIRFFNWRIKGGDTETKSESETRCQGGMAVDPQAQAACKWRQWKQRQLWLSSPRGGATMPFAFMVIAAVVASMQINAPNCDLHWRNVGVFNWESRIESWELTTEKRRSLVSSATQFPLPSRRAGGGRREDASQGEEWASL